MSRYNYFHKSREENGKLHRFSVHPKHDIAPNDDTKCKVPNRNPVQSDDASVAVAPSFFSKDFSLVGKSISNTPSDGIMNYLA